MRRQGVLITICGRKRERGEHHRINSIITERLTPVNVLIFTKMSSIVTKLFLFAEPLPLILPTIAPGRRVFAA